MARGRIDGQGRLSLPNQDRHSGESLNPSLYRLFGFGIFHLSREGRTRDRAMLTVHSQEGASPADYP